MSNAPKSNTISFRAAHYQASGLVINKNTTRRDFYKLWLLESPGILKHGSTTDVIDSPVLVFLHPDVSYSYDSTATLRTGYWAVFGGELIAPIHFPASTLFHPGYASIIPLTADSRDRSAFLFQGIVDDYYSSYDNRFDSIKSAIHLLVHEALKAKTVDHPMKTGETAAHRLTTRFIDLLERQFPITTPQEPLQIKNPAAFADRLAVHVNHLNAVIRKVTGKSTSTHIAERMITESRALLKFTDWTVSEIAYALGFEYPNHFTAFVKKHTQQTPLALRR